MDKLYDMLVVGGGPGGYTAALYAARSGLKVAVLERMSVGGQMALTHQIENYPGFPEGVDGYTLGERMRAGAEAYGVRTVLTDVLSVDLQASPKKVRTPTGELEAKTVVIATGAGPRKLGLPGEEEMVGLGLSYCAHCDGNFFRNKTVVVVGGGNSAAGDALILSRICKEVILVHRRDTLRATRIYHKQLEEAGNVRFVLNSVPTALLGQHRIEGLQVKDVHTGLTQNIASDGVFVSIGRDPATGLVKDQLVLDQGGYIAADETTRTNIPGVFAVGDVRSKVLRQIVTATADGAVAAQMAEEYLAAQEL